jgi:hypothetical protein
MYYSEMMKRLTVLYLLLALLCACTGDPGTGPVEVEWEHDTCERCTMVLTDRLHSAQVRHHPPGESSRVYLFDDLGCALIWLEDKPWKDDPATEIWVTDHRNGTWIDAHSAHYVGGQETPMLYGLGAQPEPVAGSVPFERAKRHVFEVERRLNQHGAR